MNSLLYIGQNALMNSQYAISVYGNNTANAEVEGYRRRSVEYSESPSITTSVGQIGTGATISGIVRHLNEYIEAQYLQEAGQASLWQSRYDTLAQVETSFVEDEDYGTSALMDAFWEAWGTLSDYPDQDAARSTLLSTSETLTSRLNSLASSLTEQQLSLESQISQEVADTNEILAELANMNEALADAGESSSLLDQRDQLLRELATKVDTKVYYKDNGQVLVMTSEGQTMVDGGNAYTFELRAAGASASLTADSTFAGSIYYEGTSSEELTIEVVDGGQASGLASSATFRVSLDGGRTWLTNDDGSEKLYTAGPEDDSVTIGGITVWFGQTGDSGAAETTSLSAGDRFTILPKTTVAWNSTAGGLVNVTPLSDVDNAGRLTGGTLAGLLIARDECIGEYQETLDAFASSLIWEVNRIHSQGAGLTPLSTATGIYAAEHSDVPLSESGLAFADRVTSGSFSLALFDETTGASLGSVAVDFSSVTPGQATFDPTVHSLEDVAQAITDSSSGQLTATVENGRLKITAADGVTFDYSDDSAGIFAATGHNCFLSGTDADDIAVNQTVIDNPDRICAGHVNGDGESNSGDNTTALALEALSSKEVSFYTIGDTTSATLGEYFASLVSQVGADRAAAETNYEYETALAESLYDQQESASGVNLDEELTNLSRAQEGYNAASKLIQISLEMLDTIIDLA